MYLGIEKQWSCCLGKWPTGSSETETDLGEAPEVRFFSPHLETASRLYARRFYLCCFFANDLMNRTYPFHTPVETAIVQKCQ
jgi:hypothetical protein